MIGKITTGTSFRGCLQYCLNDKKQQLGEDPVMEGRADPILYHQCFGNQKELIDQFNAVRQLNPKLSKPVLHITLSLSPSEQLPKDKLMEMCEQCAREMGFENNQYVAIHHLDTHHQHLHIVANRIGFEGRTVRDSNNYKKITAYCRKMEQQYHLKQVLSPRQFLSHEQRLIPRQDQRKAQLKEHIKESLAVSRSYEEFERLMKEKKYEIIKARGIAFRDEKKVYVKGSEVGYSLHTIELTLEQNRLKQNQALTWEEWRQSRIYHQQQSNRLSLHRQDYGVHLNTGKGLAKVMDHLLKPDKSNDIPPPYELIHSKKKGLRPH